MTPSFHHVALTVNDLDKSAKWYGDKLGFKLWHRHKSATLEFVELELNGFHLELFSFGRDTEPLPLYRRDLMDDLRVVGTKHLALRVKNLDQTLTSLKAKGVEPTTEIDTASFGGRYVFIRDPNGILIELIETS
jgi:glyoxylase I family protein